MATRVDRATSDYNPVFLQHPHSIYTQTALTPHYFLPTVSYVNPYPLYMPTYYTYINDTSPYFSSQFNASLTATPSNFHPDHVEDDSDSEPEEYEPDVDDQEYGTIAESKERGTYGLSDEVSSTQIAFITCFSSLLRDFTQAYLLYVL